MPLFYWCVFFASWRKHSGMHWGCVMEARQLCINNITLISEEFRSICMLWASTCPLKFCIRMHVIAVAQPCSYTALIGSDVSPLGNSTDSMHAKTLMLIGILYMRNLPNEIIRAYEKTLKCTSCCWKHSLLKTTWKYKCIMLQLW